MAVGQDAQTLIIACGALAHELVALTGQLDHKQIDITCLPAIWHNTPDKIPAGVAAKIRAGRGKYQHIFVAYGDCGTGGHLDAVLAAEGVDRIAGPHCYQFFMGAAEFSALTDGDPTAFYLTDYLVRHFDRIIIKGLGLDRFPELRDSYFGNYTKLIYIAQTEDQRLQEKALMAAKRLGLGFEYCYRGYGELGDFVTQLGRVSQVGKA